MTKTSLNRCFKLALACLLALSLVAVPAAAVSVGNDDVPAESEVGQQVTATVTLDELYKNPQLESWTLAGSTELTDVTWTVVYYDQTGAKVGQDEFDGQNFSGADVSAADGTSEVEVTVTGTVPEVESYSYDPAQEFTAMELTQTRSGGSSNEIGTWSTHHFTQESNDARAALDEAQSAIQSASGANTKEAEQQFSNAVDAYENGNFDLATKLASEAQTKAENAQQSSQTKQLAMYAVGGVLVVALFAGGFLYWRSQQDSYDKLG
ncbi:DUF4398 domain-containing protein [Halopelagius longus]|uniref:Uncharacterized protein n=1 Tax=Halopelagius longus TaxID=1236180 RepID=A0A1H0Y3L5_9EURY|nr:DUF4398 domain-containing protein [Halopelagius longus]RDI72254.1 hypothetical protein DWB78_11325 [Halopelagius longus]SDQ09661.1 hypothetical protein SAMN05216278_0376 [Halopelagius longus]